jgi:hypothetical protein
MRRKGDASENRGRTTDKKRNAHSAMLKK